MQGFFERLQWKISVWMQGRYGMDGLSNVLAGMAIIMLLVSIIPGFDILSFPALVLMILSTVRSFSKNVSARRKELETYERMMAKPKRALSLAKKAWVNRKTTVYFKCKTCGQVLSVPRGKGTLRVVCPKCKTETKRKS